MHNKKITRILLFAMCVAALSGTVNASSPFDTIDGAGSAMKQVYTLITAIALPLAVISIVVGACKFFGLSILSFLNREKQLEAGRRQIIITVVALACIYLMPAVIMLVYDFVQDYKWKPESSQEYLSWSGNSFGGNGAFDTLVTGNALVSEKNLLPGDGFSVATAEQNQNYSTLLEHYDELPLDHPLTTLDLSNMMDAVLDNGGTVKENTYRHFCIPKGRTESELLKAMYAVDNIFGTFLDTASEIIQGSDYATTYWNDTTYRVMLIALEDYSINTSPTNEFDVICWSKATAANVIAKGNATNEDITLRFWYRGGLIPGIGYKTPYIDNYGHASKKSTVSVSANMLTQISNNGISMTYPSASSVTWGSADTSLTFREIIEDTCKDYNTMNATAYTTDDFIGYFHDTEKGWPWSDASAPETIDNAKTFYYYYVGTTYDLIHGGTYKNSNAVASDCNTGVIRISPDVLATACKNAGAFTYTYDEIIFTNSLASDFAGTYGAIYSGKYYQVIISLTTDGNAAYEAPAAETKIRIWIPVDWAD
ncbi:MAG: hypothetical protein ACI3V2_10890 [Faecousia sp.]